MATMHGKCLKKAGEKPSEIEVAVSSAMISLAESKSELQNQLSDLYFVAAKEFVLKNGKKCIVIYVPVPKLRDFQKAHKRYIQEMEKKFSGTHIVVIAKRNILPKPLRGKNRKPLGQKRPRSRTLTAVHEAILAEMVFPSDIMGRRINFKPDMKKRHKVLLDKSKEIEVDHKLETIQEVYKKLTGKDVAFEYEKPLLEK